MLSDDDARIYSALWEIPRLADPRVLVRYTTESCDGESAWFAPDPWRNPSMPWPQIVIIRETCAGIEDENEPHTEGATVAEMISLAHEIGHMRSWLNKERTEKYEQALGNKDSLSPTDWHKLERSDKVAILEEEERAWCYAEKDLRELGFFHWKQFCAAREGSLGVYRSRLRP